LVYYEQSDGRTFGVQKGDYAMLPETTFAKQSITPGAPVTFVTALVPHNGIPADVAKTVTSGTSGDMESYVSVDLPEGKLEITMRKDGTWDVARNGIAVPGAGAPREIEINVPSFGFSDIDGVPWAEDAITGLSKTGIVNGKGNNLFAPYDSVTRAEYLKLITSAFALNDKESVTSFGDVSPDDWYYDYVLKAEKSKLTKGIWEGELNGGKPITRQEIAALSYRAAVVAGVTLPKLSEPETFSDASDFASYSETPITAMQQANIINGVGEGRFAPLDTGTRAEAAKIIFGLYSLKPQSSSDNPLWQGGGNGAPDGNIFPSGDISSLTGWTAQGTDKTAMSFDPSEGHNAPGSLKLTAPKNGWFGFRHADIRVEGGAAYKFSVWVKAENLADSAVYCHFGVKNIFNEWIVKDNDSVTTNLLKDSGAGTGHGWKLLEGTYTIPDDGYNISYFTARVNTKSDGADQTAWFDDFSIVKVQ
jgi:hypothetical protein